MKPFTSRLLAIISGKNTLSVIMVVPLSPSPFNSVEWISHLWKTCSRERFLSWNLEFVDSWDQGGEGMCPPSLYQLLLFHPPAARVFPPCAFLSLSPLILNEGVGSIWWPPKEQVYSENLHVFVYILFSSCSSLFTIYQIHVSSPIIHQGC